MKSFCIVVLALVAYAAAETYTAENDNLDIEGVAADVKSLKAFVDCFNDKGDCNAVSGDFKKDLREAVQQACAKCTPAQKHIFKVFIAGLKEKIPVEFEVFRNKYDPENKYFSALEAAVAKS